MLFELTVSVAGIPAGGMRAVHVLARTPAGQWWRWIYYTTPDDRPALDQRGIEGAYRACPGAWVQVHVPAGFSDYLRRLTADDDNQPMGNEHE